ncbi:FtsX-like permease family protein [Maribellus comscasis]|uniref:FtsX-like permease family protein n=1 Tax=Maribellus comscasis TaxID=2681766 RepID=A0A6I6JTT6_9BACT|nr:ABC transporter permease [Maribellus comscasis]QGY44669.1 FtsX-like permease family protein [Maribellus comscasis]
MYWSYLKTGLRNLLRNKLLSAINIAGFSVGLAVSFLIILWITYEVGFDKFHENAENIYRVVTEFEKNGSPDNFAHTPAPLGPALKEEFPEVLEYTRCSGTGKTLITCAENQFWGDIFVADESIFKTFSFRLQTGNPETIFSSPHSIVLSQNMAEKYFRGKNPLGQTISVGFDNQQVYTVTGVLENIPSNSQFHIDFLLPFSRIAGNSGWGIKNYTTYILLNAMGDYKSLQNKLRQFMEKYSPDKNTKLHLQPFTRIHLFSDLRSDLSSNVHYTKLVLYAAIALIILLLASVNFINLSLAKSALRNKEIGIRKITGASNKQLKSQFLSESFMVTFVSFLLAIPLIYFFLPVFNEFIDKNIVFSQLFNLKSVTVVIGLLIVLSFVNGLYPAFILSSYNPMGILKGNFNSRQHSVTHVRQTLVIFQFVVAIFFISGTLLIKSQLNFMKYKNLGFDKEQVIIIPAFYDEVKQKSDLLSGEIKKSAYVKEISFTSYLPTERGYSQNVWWEGMEKNENRQMNWIAADENFVDLMGIKLKMGRNFDKNQESDKHAYIINEEAAKEIDWDMPLGKLMDITEKGEVIGVVEDFNFKSLHSTVAPAAIKIFPGVYKYIYIKTMPNSVSSALTDVKTIWSALLPDRPFEFTFLANNLDEVYKKEAKENKILNYISLFAILIAAMGVLGLSSLLVTNRIKEIGIRKVNGAKVSEILSMLNKDFVIWVAVAFLIAGPVAWYSMNKWLESFAYKTTLSWWIFALAGMLGLGIALLTVSWQSWRAATRNPVDALRYE